MPGYRYSPARCCCGGCDFVDDFEAVQFGYQITPHAGDPSFDVADGSLSLTGGDGSLWRLVAFDAAQVETDGTGGLSAAAILGASSGLTGVFVGGVKGFAADWAGNRYVAFDCDPQGTPGDLETVGSLHPTPGDSIECRVAWSALTSSWRAQFYVNGAFQPFANVAVEFSGNSQRLGLVGEEGANWVFYRQDCSVTLTSATFCVDFPAGSVATLPFSLGFIPIIHWIDTTRAVGNTDSDYASAGPCGIIPGRQGLASDWLVASNFNVVIPDGAVLVGGGGGVIPIVMYKFTNEVNGGSFNGGVHFQAVMDGALLPNSTGTRAVSVPKNYGPQLTGPGPGWRPNPAHLPLETMLYEPGYGFAFRYLNLNGGNFALSTMVHSVDSMWLRVCYRIDA